MKSANPPLNNVMDLLLDAICIVDLQGNFVYVSAAGERIFGYAPQEMVGRNMMEFIHPEDRERTQQAAEQVVSGKPLPYFENRYVRKDGQIVHIMWSARWSEADQMRVAVARDISERKRAEALQAALYAISEAVHAAEGLPDLFRQIHQITAGLLPAADFTVALYDRKRDELSFPYHANEHSRKPATQQADIKKLCADLIHDGQARLFQTEVTQANTGTCGGLGVPLKSGEGIIGALLVMSSGSGTQYHQQDIELLQFISSQIATAIERKQLQMALQHSARYDTLTELPNRELLHERVLNALCVAERNHTPLALLYLDLDRFKEVNDSLGHQVGDLLLQEAARRLSKCVRKSDSVGRLGGDEFMVLLNNTPRADVALLVAEKIRAALNQPFDLDGHRVHISPSIGISLYPTHGSDCKQLILYADEAMYDAKKRGGNQCRLTSRSEAVDSPQYRTRP